MSKHKVDRSEWDSGPWDLEKDDKVVWIDPKTGLDCMILRNQWGTWCGYVGLPPGHAHHQKKYSDLWYEVHGGLTYSGFCSGPICHVPEPGRPEYVWWIGFDCNHSCDISPRNYGWSFGTYRTQEYVRQEVTKLAQQAAAVGD